MLVFITSQVLTVRREPLKIVLTRFPTKESVASTMPFPELKNSNASRNCRRVCVSPYMRSGDRAVAGNWRWGFNQGRSTSTVKESESKDYKLTQSRCQTLGNNRGHNTHGVGRPLGPPCHRASTARSPERMYGLTQTRLQLRDAFEFFNSVNGIVLATLSYVGNRVKTIFRGSRLAVRT